MLQYLRDWLGRPPVPSPLTAAPREHARAIDLCPLPELTALETLWSEGFSGPGGAEPALALVRMLDPGRGTLLLVGAGRGGPAFAVAAHGHPVVAYEADLVALARARTLAARDRLAGVSLHDWDPAAPDFGTAAYGHAVLLDPGAPPHALVPAVIAALRPGGRIAMACLVADRALAEAPALPSEMAVTRAFLRAGCTMLDSADIGAPVIAQALAQWGSAVRAMEQRPPVAGRAAVLAEAERWRHQVEWLQTGRVRLVRWLAAAPRAGVRT